jgi:hypothetical protein
MGDLASLRAGWSGNGVYIDTRSATGANSDTGSNSTPDRAGSNAGSHRA